MPQPARRTIHYTELPDMPPDSPLHREWDFFRRELPRLLAEGHEGKFVLVKHETIAGFYTNMEDGLEAGYTKFGVDVPFLLQPIRSEEPLLLLPWYCLPCRI